MVATIIAIISLLFSGLTFLLMDMRLKKQEQILNEYKIAEYKKAEQDNLYAHLTMDTYWRDKGTLCLTIGNNGPSDAYNVSVKNLDKESFLFRDIESSFPIKLIDSGDSVQVELLVYSDMPEKTRVQVTWEDDSKEKHSDKVVLHIH